MKSLVANDPPVNSDDEGSSDSSIDSANSDEVQEALDQKFFTTMALLMSKDEDKVKKLKELQTEEPTIPDDKYKQERSQNKPLYLKDYESQIVLNDNCEYIDEANYNNLDTKKFKKTTEDRMIIDEIVCETNKFMENISNDEFIFEPSSKTDGQQEKSNRDYLQWLKGNFEDISNNAKYKELETLKSYWSNQNISEQESFIKDYILNKKYLFSNIKKTFGDNPSSLSIEESSASIAPECSENHFEIISYPRNIKSSSRAIKSKRVEKREHHKMQKVKKKIEMMKKLDKLKIEKKHEIMRKINEIDKISGEKTSKSSADINNENSYMQESDYELEGEKLSKRQLKKIKRIEKSKNRLKSKTLDPNEEHPDLIDEYYNLDYEDIIDDTPVRYNYRTVIPNSYGLTPEEILLCDDKELNKWCSLKRIIKYTDEVEEMEDIKQYKKRNRNLGFRKRVLSSLYSPIDSTSLDKAEAEKEFKSDKCAEQSHKQDISHNNQSIKPNRKRLIDKYFRNSQPRVVNTLTTDRLLAYNLHYPKN